MYSTKTIEKILISALQQNKANKTPIQASALSPETENKFQVIEDIEQIKEVLLRPEYNQAFEAYKQGRIIYRGARQQEQIKAAIVTPGIRISKNTSNIYTRLVSDVFASWQDFPKRNRSTICSTNYMTAREYSHYFPFVIFPQNNTKIGICSKSDIWYSFPFLNKITGINQLLDFNIIAISILEEISDLSTRDIINLFENGTVSDIKQLFANVEEKCLDKMKNSNTNDIFIRNIANNQLLSPWYWTYHKKMSLLDYIEYSMLPQKNKFKLISIDEIPKSDKELWFEGQHLMIRFDILRKILETF